MTKPRNLFPSTNFLANVALLVGVLALALGVVGAFLGAPDRFFQSYLFSFLFWLGISLGSLGILGIHHLAGGRWGLTIRRILEAAAGAVPLMAVLFIPLLFGLQYLFPWARPEVVNESGILQHKAAYLNVPFFIIRAVVYFVIWSLLAYAFNRLSARLTRSGDLAVRSRLTGWGAAALILYILTMTFAATDWVMSLQPFWNSSIYGILIVVGQMLSALAFAIVVINLLPGFGLGRSWNFRTTPVPFRDLGAFLFTFVLGWAYLAYFQLLIIWAGNIPREVVWYLDRTSGGWQFVAWMVALLLFVLPFLVLLSIRARHNLRILGLLGVGISLMYLVNMFWQVIPAFHPGQFSLHWLDLVMPVAVGSLWLAAFFWMLGRRPALTELESTAIEAEASGEAAVFQS